jgi:tetrahydromethanopterin S-methyltransferase subunit G
MNGKKVSPKKQAVTEYKWAKHFGAEIDEIKRRLDILEAKMPEVEKLMVAIKHREEFQKFMEALPEIKKEMEKFKRGELRPTS